jgi:hypothetical protein
MHQQGSFQESFKYSRVHDAKADESCTYYETGIDYHSAPSKTASASKQQLTIKTDGKQVLRLKRD